MVTIKDIARELGIAPSTVSMALKDSPLIGVATREKVKALAKKLNYVPNSLGRALQSRRSSLVGYLTDRVTESFYDILVLGVGETVVKHGYGLLTGVVDSVAALESQLHIFREKQIEGMVVTLTHLKSPKTLTMLKESGIPMVFCSGRGGPEDLFVMCDDVLGGELAVEHLIERGHRYLGCNRTGALRLEGNRRALARHGLPEPYEFGTPEELVTLLRKHPEITAVTVYSDRYAIDILNAVRGIGLRVPEDLALVGFDDLWFAGLENFNFTTIAQPKREIGQRAMEMLFELVNGKIVQSQLMRPELVVRGSTK